MNGYAIVAACSQEDALNFWGSLEPLRRQAVLIRELTALELTNQHRVIPYKQREWLNAPAGSSEVFIDALGRDLIEGVSVPYLFSTTEY